MHRYEPPPGLIGHLALSDAFHRKQEESGSISIKIVTYQSMNLSVTLDVPQNATLDIAWGDNSNTSRIFGPNATEVIHNYNSTNNFTIYLSGRTRSFAIRATDTSVLSSVDFSNATGMGISNMSRAFEKISSAFQVIGGLPPTVKILSRMFLNATKFNDNIGNWTIINVRNMASMFENATSFNQPLSSWNVTGATEMSAMFRGATSFNQSLARWCIPSIREPPGYFADGSGIKSTELPQWGHCSTLRGPTEEEPKKRDEYRDFCKRMPAGCQISESDSGVDGAVVPLNSTLKIDDDLRVPKNVSWVFYASFTSSDLANATLGSLETNGCFGFSDDGTNWKLVVNLWEGATDPSFLNGAQFLLLSAARPDCFDFNQIQLSVVPLPGSCRNIDAKLNIQTVGDFVEVGALIFVGPCPTVVFPWIVIVCVVVAALFMVLVMWTDPAASRTSCNEPCACLKRLQGQDGDASPTPDRRGTRNLDQQYVADTV
jgi:hypothetical protein